MLVAEDTASRAQHLFPQLCRFVQRSEHEVVVGQIINGVDHLQMVSTKQAGLRGLHAEQFLHGKVVFAFKVIGARQTHPVVEGVLIVVAETFAGVRQQVQEQWLGLAIAALHRDQKRCRAAAPEGQPVVFASAAAPQLQCTVSLLCCLRIDAQSLIGIGNSFANRRFRQWLALELA